MAPIEVSEETFERMVTNALERIPGQFLDRLENCIFVIEENSLPGEPTMLGLYDGVPVTERDDYSGFMPDRIILFQRPLMSICETEEELEEQVFVTMVHEIGHYFGLDDDRLHELDWG